jgi:hypothetical protein
MKYTINRPLYESSPQLYNYCRDKLTNIIPINDSTHICNILDIDYEIFINKNDFKNYTSEDEKTLCISLVNSIFEYIPLISTLDIINNNEHDDDFITYLQVVANTITNITHYMTNYSWIFDPMDKMLWIYLILACKYESRALKYINLSKYFNTNVMYILDKYNRTYIHYLLLGSIDILKLSHNFKLINESVMMTDMKHNDVPTIMYILFDEHKFKYILEILPNITQYFNTIFNNNLTMFSFACHYNPDVAKYMLDNDYITQECFTTLYKDNISCIMFSINTPELFYKLINHKYCTNELFKQSHPSYGNILNIAINLKTEYIKHIINSQYFDKSMITTLYDTSKNALYDIANSTLDLQILILLIEKQYVTIDMFNNCKDIYYMLLINNKLYLQYIFNKYTNLVILDNLYNYVEYSAYYNQEILKLLLDLNLIDRTILFKYHNSTHNILSLMLNSPNINSKIITDIINEYCYPDDFSTLSTNNIINKTNIFYDIANNIPSLALDILNSDIFLEDNLLCEFNDGIPIYVVILNTINDEQFINGLLNSKYFKNEYLSYILPTKETLLLNIINNNSKNLKILLNNNRYKNYIINLDSNKANNSVLINYISGIINIDVYQDIINVSNHNMISYVDKKGNNAFLLSCYLGYKYALPVLNSNFFDKDIFNIKQYDNSVIPRREINCLSIACSTKDINFVKYLCEHEYMTQKMFNKQVIYYAFANTNIFKYIINHKYCKKKYILNILTECVNNYCNYFENIMIILKSGKFTSEMYYVYIHYLDKYLINVIIDKFNITKKYINFDVITTNMLKLSDNHKRNILMKLIVDRQFTTFKKIRNLGIITDDILKMQDIYGYTLLHLLTKYNAKYFSDFLSNFKLHNIINIKDNFGNTCLHSAIKRKYSKLVNIILDSKYCTQELLLCTDAYNNNILHYCYDNIQLINKIIDHKNFTIKLIEQFNDKFNPFIEICMMYGDSDILNKIISFDNISNKLIISNDICILHNLIGIYPRCTILKFILESEKIDLSSIINNYYDNINVILYAIQTRNIDALKLLFDSKYDFSPSFDMSPDDLSAIMINNGIYIFDIIYKSKYYNIKYTQNLLKNIFKYGKLEFMKYMYIDGQYNTDYLKDVVDNGNNILYYCENHNIDIFKFLLNSPDYCTTDILCHKNKLHMTILHHYYKNINIIEIILNSIYCTKSLIFSRDMNGDTILHKLVANNIKFESLIDTNLLSILMQIKNNVGMTPLMMLVKNRKKIDSVVMDIINAELLGQSDIKNRNVLMYAVKYNCTQLVDFVINNNIVQLIDTCNIKNKNSLVYGSKYNSNYIKKIINFGKFNDILYTSCETMLIMSSVYQPFVLKYILDWDKFNINLINVTNDNGYNILQLGCIYNSKSVQILLKSNYDITCLFTQTNNNTDPALFLATIYNPNALNYILESKYCNVKMFTTIHNNQTIIDHAFENQPKSLKIIVQSPHMTSDFISRENFKGWSLLTILKSIYPNINNISDILENKLMMYDNERTDNEDLQCDICYNFKYKICFYRCGHKACIGCAFKINKCHHCRKDIRNKIFMY